MTDDAANSSAMGIIKELGAQNRTIGISVLCSHALPEADDH